MTPSAASRPGSCRVAVLGPLLAEAQRGLLTLTMPPSFSELDIDTGWLDAGRRSFDAEFGFDDSVLLGQSSVTKVTPGGPCAI